MICSLNEAGLYGNVKLDHDSNNNSKLIYQGLFIITYIIASISERHQAVLGSSRVSTVCSSLHSKRNTKHRIILSLHINLSAPVPVTTDHGPVHDLAH